MASDVTNGLIGALVGLAVILAKALYEEIKKRRNGHGHDIGAPVDRREHLTGKLLDIIAQSAAAAEKLAGAIEKLHDTLTAHHQAETLWYERMARDVAQLDHDMKNLLNVARNWPMAR